MVSLWLPRWSTDRLHRRHREAAAGDSSRAPAPARPLVTVLVTGGRVMVAAVDGAAAACGILPGMALADARALQPDLAVRPADPAGDQAALARLADWCMRYTPWVALDGADGLWLDVTGCARLFGGEPALLADLANRFERFGYAARLGLADTPGAAWALARFSGNAAAAIPAGGQRAALAGLPVAALRLAPAVAAELDRLGLKRIGDLYPLPRAALARRFGLEPGRRLDQALGRIDEPLSPRAAPNPHEARLSFAEPIAAAESIAAALDRLLAGLCRHLAAEQLGVRRLLLAVYRVDGSFERMAIGTSRANRDPAALRRLFLPHLERIDPGFGIETIVLAAALVQATCDLQMVLEQAHAEPAHSQRPAPPRGLLPPPAAAQPAPPRATPPDAGRPPLPAERGEAGLLVADLVDQLANDREPARLYRPARRESHLPERAVARMPALAEPSLPWGEAPPRPVRLLARPEPVEVDPASPTALPALFFWRARPHRLRRIEGPERIAPEWWSSSGDGAGSGARDYFRVEDMEGRRFWLYREPMEGREPGAATDAPARWYLHGLFA